MPFPTPVCAVLKVFDKDGNPVQGERVQFDFVSDDGNLAPASGDLAPRSMLEVLQAMGGDGGDPGVRLHPQGHFLGSRQSRYDTIRSS